MMQMPPGQHGPIGKTRNPVMVFLISCICFVYAMIAIWQMIGELNAFRGKNDVNPIMLFVPVLNIFLILGLPAKVAEAQRMAGIAQPSVGNAILYLLFGIYFFPADLNKVWEAARRGG